MARQNKTRVQGFKYGPKFTTERGKRRHAARTPCQQAHASKVWGGGYTIEKKATPAVTDEA